MKSFSFVRERGVAHDRIGVFVGPDRDHRAMAGSLVLHADEADALWRLLNPGANEPLDVMPHDNVLEIQLGHEHTGLTATWCPICGDCSCEPDAADIDCQLHGLDSKHAQAESS